MRNNADEEQLAWVDEDEKLIKVIPYSLANSDPKYLHQEIAGIVYDTRHRVLLQQRALSKRVYPGVWTVTVAGHVTYGDTLEQTYHKELQEEMGIVTPHFVYLFRENVRQATEHHYCHWYLGLYERGKITIQPEEVAAYAWVGQQDYLKFSQANTINLRTGKMLSRFWSGEWDKLL